MKFKITAVLAFCFLAATTVFAQSWDSEIEGSGTTGYIPVFTSFHRQTRAFSRRREVMWRMVRGRPFGPCMS